MTCGMQIDRLDVSNLPLNHMTALSLNRIDLGIYIDRIDRLDVSNPVCLSSRTTVVEVVYGIYLPA